MYTKILVCDPIAESGIELLKSAGFGVDVKFDLTPEELKQTIVDYDALIVRSRTMVTKEVIEAGKKLKAIGRAGVGLDNIDVAAAQKCGIDVLNAPESLMVSVAELTIGLMISVARQIPKADQTMKEGKWIKKELTGTTLEGKTLGIVGFGRVGGAVASIARAMGMNILVNDPRVDQKRLEEVNARAVSLEELLRESDFVTLHVALTPNTRHLIGEKQLQMMKTGAYLINTSRGAVIDDEAVLKSLKGGKLAGAAFDVYDVEPPTDLSLVKMDNVVCTPHIGSQTVEAQESAGVIIAEKVINSLKRLR